MTMPGNGYHVCWKELQRRARAVGERPRANAAPYAPGRMDGPFMRALIRRSAGEEENRA
ncbi:hypothetical protein IMZ11_16025 [Microtetraspora sp. AC03309]|uniref:hypothetical protein n=1 Tax=Microtetraspora sp. AC03309 TaxID=2779376 RepID=UPI001E334B34|nr:hypothetical protein [Microtetraspora sp. AC03309]MCC5577134.1 hypothetical protein [Microtetraspora sp. AC03309]